MSIAPASPARAASRSAQVFCSIDRVRPTTFDPAPRGSDGQAAPAAADFEQAVAGLEGEAVEEEVDLAVLGGG